MNLFRIVYRGLRASDALGYTLAVLKRENVLCAQDPEGFGVKIQTDKCQTYVISLIEEVASLVNLIDIVVWGLVRNLKLAIMLQLRSGGKISLAQYAKIFPSHREMFDRISQKLLETCKDPSGAPKSDLLESNEPKT